MRPIAPGAMLEVGAIAPDAAGDGGACVPGLTGRAAVDVPPAEVATGPTGAHAAATSARANAQSPTWIDGRRGIALTVPSVSARRKRGGFAGEDGAEPA